ncbi:hypothetical protein [Actinomadura sp. DC4]|uniref:hypothetical protein n=1 Tax=Actinomadura sp. DC4 TaxID=3055069 RepID=UPI0025B066C0|nr:hypothetical protein [Actinomadura sp. DC4]
MSIAWRKSSRSVAACLQAAVADATMEGGQVVGLQPPADLQVPSTSALPAPSPSTEPDAPATAPPRSATGRQGGPGTGGDVAQIFTASTDTAMVAGLRETIAERQAVISAELASGGTVPSDQDLSEAYERDPQLRVLNRSLDTYTGPADAGSARAEARTPRVSRAGSPVPPRSVRSRPGSPVPAFLDAAPRPTTPVEPPTTPVEPPLTPPESPVAHPESPVAHPEPPVAHPAAEVTADSGPDLPRDRTDVTLGGLPAGVGWAHARLARSWDLRFDTADATSPYAAVLAASNGSVSAGGQVFRDADGLRGFVAGRMRDAPLRAGGQGWPPVEQAYRQAVVDRLAGGTPPEGLQEEITRQLAGDEAWQQMVASFQSPGHWDELERALAPVMLSEYLGKSLLVLHAGGRMSSFGSGPALVVAERTDPAGTAHWTGVPSMAAGPALGGLSGGQVERAASDGMVFLGDRGGDFFDALAAAGRAVGLGELFGDPEELRNELGRRMRVDTELERSDDWAAIKAEYIRVAVREAVDGLGAESTANRDLGTGEAWQEIIAYISSPGPERGRYDALLPLLVRRYLNVGVLETNAELSSAHDVPRVTVARLTGDTPSWLGLAPVRAPHALGADTRPADVGGGRSAYDPAGDLAATTGPAPTGREPEGMSAAQWQWTLGRNRRFAEVPTGDDAFFDAVLEASGGGFSAGPTFVGDVPQLRAALVEKIREVANEDPDLWLVVHTIYADLYQRSQAGAGDPNAQARARIDDGRALSDIIDSIASPGVRPELAEKVAPYILNKFGLAVRTVDTAGVVGRYGRGRPLYVAPLTDAANGDRRWAALPRTTTRFALGSPLAAPNLSDPILVRLGQAADARRAALTADGVQAASADPVLTWLTDARKSWLAGGADSPSSPGGVRWTPDELKAKVAELDAAGHASLGSFSRGGGDAVGAGLNLGSAVRLMSLLFPAEHGGIRPAPDPGRTGDVGQAEIGADQWVVAPSLRELIREIPAGGAVLFAGDERTWVAVNTTGGLRLTEFGPGDPADRVFVPSPVDIASMKSPGLALVVGQDGQVIPAEALTGPFDSAAGWDGGDLPATGSFHRTPAAAGAASWASEKQNTWVREHGRRFVDPRPGDNAFFEAAITAAGGRLTVNGEEVTDATGLRTALAEWIRVKAAAPGGLSQWPLATAAYRFAAKERVIEEFLGEDLAKLNHKSVDGRIDVHLGSGAAAEYTGAGVAEPGHWEELVRMLAPGLVAEGAGVGVKVLEPDGRVRAYEPAGGGRADDLVLARASGSSGWAALMPEPGARPAEVGADETTRFTAGVPTGEMAVLSGGQQHAQGRLTVQPTEAGANSFYSALLAASGGGVMLGRETFVDTPSGLREGLARLVRNRPDVLSEENLQAIGQSVGAETVIGEHIVAALTDPAAGNIDEIARHLVGPYLGVELSVLEHDGEIRTYGHGRPVTLAPTGDAADPHWAALVPGRPPAALQGLPGLPGLPALPGIDEPLREVRWSRDHFKNVGPGAQEAEDPWRNSTFCLTDAAGAINCVSVTVVYQGSQP